MHVVPRTWLVQTVKSSKYSFMLIWTFNTIYIIKQDIRIYVPYSRPNGSTEWAEIFCGHSWVAFFFFHGQRRALQLVTNKLHRNKIYYKG